MRLSAFTYYADYVVFPTGAVALSAAGAVSVSRADLPYWGLALLGGMILWPLLEYVLHRWVFHRLAPIRQMHEAHHQKSTALIGTRWWISLPLVAVLALLPASLIMGFGTAAGFTSGLMLGYTGYMLVHHGVHHWSSKSGTFFDRLKRRHVLHHRFDARGDYDQGNYGVVTGFWDRVFGTDLGMGPIAVRRARGDSQDAAGGG
ncbi:MAG: sterol desaturase family protein [Bauldia sp.]|nr:sterol desaturase family protein [Bauldia sp.]